MTEPRRHKSLIDLWRSWSLARQFQVAASLVLIPAMALAGTWIGRLIEDGATRRSAAAAALYLENFVEPVAQELADRTQLSAEGAKQLDTILADSALRRRVVTFKLWGKGGRVLYATRKELTGQSFEPSANLRQAWLGQVSAEFDNLRDAENAAEQALGMPIVEIYLPLRQRGSDRIIAVAEFYERADDLKVELKGAIAKSRIMVAGLTLAMLGALFALVRQGSRTIEMQRFALEDRIGDLTRTLDENKQLRTRLQQASVRTTEGHEQFLRRLGADLHDGPAQLIGVALLKLGATSPDPGSETRAVLERALNELRHIAAGFAVPEIEGASLRAAIVMAADRHTQITRTPVAVTTGDLPRDISAAVKLCAYRVVQEGLSNAFRHGGGKGQQVWAGLEDSMLAVRVIDQGSIKENGSNGKGLGLPGLKDRVETLGGTLDLARCPINGMQLSVRLPVREVVPHG